ncbi:MAG: hypothetical protein AMK75_05070 [Planctomycetes bacterium SM23_65]|nr:MAG: hypothetical protein AMK75_05070 [Planctomycetes bacterium SM23_65]
MSLPLHDRCGAVHVHSVQSDGSATIPEIIQTAQAAELDFLILTDHARRQRQDVHWQGWHEELLVIVGAEVETTDPAHVVVLGTKDAASLRGMSTAECLSEIKARGGYSFVAHPRGKKMIHLDVPGWTAWDNPDYTGIEFWSYMHDWIEEFKWRRLWRFYRKPHREITGPHPEVLAAWDRVAMRRRVSGIAGLDAHAKPLVGAWFEFFPYQMLFGTTLTHVLVEDFSGDDDADVRRILEALAVGRCYVGYHVLGDPTGFDFRARTASGESQMGEEVKLAESLVLCVSLPAAGEIRLVACGEAAAEARGTQAEFRPTRPGPHRIEVRSNSRPWIFSNYIYVTDERAAGCA